MAVTATRLDDCLSIRAGHLWMEECDTVDLARRFGTPLYAVSENQLRRNARRIGAAFAAGWPDGPTALLPSLKANLSLALRAILNAEGLGADTFGPGELHAALAAGTEPGLISVNGSVKDAALVGRAVAAGTLVTLDSPGELDLVAAAARTARRPAQIRLRLRPDYAGMDQPSDFEPGRSVRESAIRYKPGIPLDVAPDVARRALATDGVELVGVMAHLGRHSTALDVWAGMGASFAAAIAGLCTALGGWRPAQIDVGGGYPAPRDPTGSGPEAPPIETLAGRLIAALRAGLQAAGIDPSGIRLEAEPGRALYADTGIHLATVRNTKHQSAPVEWDWVETDTTEMFMADLLIEHARFGVVAASRADAPASTCADVVGMSCGFDVLAPKARLPELEGGDVLAFLDTGAYQDACASNFNGLPRPATVLVRGGEAEIVKRAETVADVFARDVIPARLR
jgi:diaminopimelate decarboxylase